MPYLLNLVLFFAFLDPEVTFLVTQMGDEEWDIRETATAKLVKMDERPIKLLRLAQKDNPDLEIRRRAKKIVSRYEGSIAPSKEEKTPWIDHLPEDFPDRDTIIKTFIRPYRSQYQYEYGNQGEGYQIFRDATRDFILDYSRKGHTREECIELLDKMVENQKTWLASQHPNYFYKNLPDD